VNVRVNWRLMLAVVAAVLLVALAVRVVPFLSLATLETNQRELSTYGAAHPVGMASIFGVPHVGFAALPLPGEEVLTIAAGALFALVGSECPAARKRTVAACTRCCGPRWALQQTPDSARPGRDEIGQEVQARF